MKAQVKVGRKNGRGAELAYDPVEDLDAVGGKRRAWTLVLTNPDGHVAKRIHVTDGVDVSRSEAIALLAATSRWTMGT